MAPYLTSKAEWLEADGLGGFASGSVDGIRRRRYHALLLAATTPPTGRVVLVNGLDAWIETPAGTFALSSQAYTPDVVHPDGARRIAAFAPEPWPCWTFRLEDGTEIVHEIVVEKGVPVVALSWRLRLERDRAGGRPGSPPATAHGVRPGSVPAPTSHGVTLSVRPFLSGRDYHVLHHENPAFRFAAEIRDGRVVWRPYDGVPGVIALTNGEYVHDPVWYRNFLYEEERARGLECTEDLAAPGIFRWNLARGEAVLLLAPAGPGEAALMSGAPGSSAQGSHDAEPVGEASSAAAAARVSPAAPAAARARLDALHAAERERRRGFPSRLHRAADAYLIRRGTGRTIIAGYPWFTDWGRDTCIALRGLCLATGRLDDARAILLAWADTVSEGMLPNRFPDHGAAPEFNTVDASLWYVVVVHDLLRASDAKRRALPARDRRRLGDAIEAILSGYARGTRHGIHLDDDGLLAAGEPGVQLTWMDAKVGDWVVTPRIGKPVEVQALWLNALHIAAELERARARGIRIGSTPSARWQESFRRGCESFRVRFWNDAGGCLYDVVDPDHHAGATDATFRPNQIFAVGGLPLVLLEADRARRVVTAVEARLLTPLGLRSLAPGEPGYAPRYEGGVRERDAAYHQGTVWPWLLGPFVEAWVRVHGGTPAVKRAARARYLDPLLRHLDEAGLGHLPEIACGDPPHRPRGCPFQAWSVGEALRLAEIVLAEG